ncbi:facilitated trehalose transporter Tret1-like [Cylas formicarius]|uniref:facilitated trehalose transporter Tret1-like n=1 Tax=Cylas formicarius TaxID=197179 RepID=UPI0029589728|nr:facilitated trehalose transporter Tret1-like [Cylas formicarius]
MVSNALVSVFAVDLLATSGDITQTWTSPMYPKLYSNDTSVNPLAKPITEEQDAWIGSLLNIGAMIGALPVGFIADTIGRKKSLLCIAIPHLVAYLMFVFADEVYMYYIARFINGLSVGAGYALMPMYIAEICTDKTRNSYTATLNIFWTFGNFLPYAIGPYISVQIFNSILVGFPAVFIVVFILVAPETPLYLVQKGRIEEAEKCLMTLRSTDKAGVEKEIIQIKDIIAKHEDGTLMDIFRNPGLRRAFAISASLVSFGQLAGSTAIGYYLQPILEESNTHITADIGSTLCGAWTFISSFSSSFAIHRLGQRIPLIISCVGNALSIFALGLYFHIRDTDPEKASELSWLPIASLLSFIAFYNFGLSGIPWAVSSQLFPNNVKAISAASISSVSWFFSFLTTNFFNDMNDTFGRAGTFWIFSSANLVAAVFTIIWVPETKGMSFTEIHDMLQNEV